MNTSARPSLDPEEIAKFAAMAEAWWDPEGQFKALHRLNPTRLAFIRDRAARHFRLDLDEPAPLSGLSVLDVGCGGGLLAAPLARLGAAVTGIDAAAESIEVARLYAEEQGLEIDYRNAAAEDLAREGAAFDLVVNMEVVEHVADVPAFIDVCCALVRPGGAMAVATLNRTSRSYALAIVGAEYLLRWLPPGTHDWNRFVRPDELVEALATGGLRSTELTGVAYNPLSDSWRLTRDSDVNYMVFAVKDEAAQRGSC